MTLYIAEFSEIAIAVSRGSSQQQGITHIAQTPPVAEQTLTAATTAACY